MSFYLPNPDVHPTGFEAAEFLDLPPMAEVEGHPGTKRHEGVDGPIGAGPARTYGGSRITVHWDPTRCIHAERCVSGAPRVFDRAARPWVRPDAATADEIAAVIDTCPSGALSYTRHDGTPNGRRGRGFDEDPTASTTPDPERSFFDEASTGLFARTTPVTIAPQLDGPLLVEGDVGLTRPDGSTERAGRLALCRCGQSGSKPNCDGTHVRVGFMAPGVES